jgi:hypothetical protein
MGARRERRVRALIKALRPFAEIIFHPATSDDCPLVLQPLGKATIRVRHVRAARRAIRKARE